MRAFNLTFQMAIALCCLAVANLGVHWLSQTTLPRKVLARGQNSPPATDLFLGNSLIVAGIDEDALCAEAPERIPLELALGGTGPVEHLLIYREQHRHGHASVFYGFFDTQLTNAAYLKGVEHRGNRTVAYYTDPETASQYYYPDSPWDRSLFLLGSTISLFVERHAVWGKVEALRRRLDRFGLPARATNEFGRADDFTSLETPVEDHIEHCRRFVRGEQGLDPALLGLIDTAKRRGAKFTIIEMPMPERHRKRYYESPEWLAYRQKLTDTLHTLDVSYLNASDWVPEDGFHDILHLNAVGAERFSKRLRYSSPALDGARSRP